MSREYFKQGMSHEDALAKDKGYKELISQAARDRFNNHYANLPDRPDFDGVMSYKEYWTGVGKGDSPCFWMLRR